MSTNRPKNTIKRQIKKAIQEEAVDIVYPGTQFDPDREAILNEFKGIRQAIFDKQTPKDNLRSKMLQLKFMMQEYLQTQALPEKQWETQKAPSFAAFLKEYIHRVNRKNKDFAQDISVKAAELSLVINSRRKPTEKIIYRLEIHSNHFFPAVLWFKIMEKDRENELRSNHDIIEKERKHVKKVLEIA
ncbi:hypothetical protein [Flavihumibacter petaseus]|nr:hypothetical protein [Flavihumibacter petaseus]